MVLWVDKYRPKTLEKLDLQPKVTTLLQKLLESGDLPHIMLYGPSGAGKATRVNALLRALFGPGVEKVKVTHKTFKVKSKTIEVATLASNYHIEINPSQLGASDRFVVQEVIKEIAQTQNVSLAGGSKEGGEDKEGKGGRPRPTFKVVVLKEVDCLSRQAQQALRRTMEKYMSSCRLILCCESSSRVLGPVKSRVLPIRVPAPTEQEICDVLQFVAAKETIVLPEEMAVQIAGKSGRNLRRALLMLESAKVQQYPFAPGQVVRPADWERFVDDLGKIICEEQSPQRLLLARNKMYELLSNCIPAEVVLKTLTTVLLKRLDDQLKHQVIRWSAHYDHRMKLGSKPIFHLEAFVAKFMAIYKRWIIESFG